MKKILLILITVFMVGLVGCGSSDTAKKAIEEGKIAFASKEYDKAEGILKLAVTEKGGKEAESLYAQVSSFRIIKDEIYSTDVGQNFGFMSNEEVINSFFKVLDNLKIIEENKSESTIVVDELEEIHSDVRIKVTELIGDYNEYIKDLDVEIAEIYLEHIRRVYNYNFEFMKDYELDIKQYEKLLDDAKKTLNNIYSNTDGYTKEEINNILNQRFEGNDTSGASVFEDIVTINNEACYEGQAFWNSGNRVRNFYVGTQTGNVYNGLKESVGRLETFNFGDIE